MVSLFRVQLAFLGFCTVLAPILLMAWFSLCPQYGNPQCPSSANIPSALEAFRNADPGLMSIFLTINTIAPYVLPLSILALGIVGMKRSPLLSTLGIVSGWMGSIAWGFIAAAIFVFNDAANLGNNASVSLLSTIYLQWQVYYVVAAGWVLGHLAGYVLLGAALWRGGAAPRWAALMLIVSAPIMGPISYGLGNGWLQVAGYGLVLIGSLPVALKMMKTRVPKLVVA